MAEYKAPGMLQPQAHRRLRTVPRNSLKDPLMETGTLRGTEKRPHSVNG